MKKFLYLFFLSICSFLSAQIVEIKNVSEIKNLEKYQLILFDLDNTILETIQQLGSDQWFFDRLKEYENQGLDKKKALDKTLSDWYEIQSITKVRLVEQETKKLIDYLQSKEFKVMCITIRNMDFAFATIKQMDSLNIDLSKTAPFDEILLFKNDVFFKKGILFSNGKNKGEALKEFFKKIGFFPKSIVLIDDKLKHLLEVESFCKSSKIEFLGYRYGHLDEKIKNYDSKISKIQIEHFNKILSDDEAKAMVK